MIATAAARTVTPKIDTNGQLASYVHTRVISEQRSKEQKRKLTRSERAQARLETRSHLQNLCTAIGEQRLAEKIGLCHSKLAVLTCGKHVARVIPNHVCEFRLCPDCGRRRARRLSQKYLPAAVAFPKASHTEAVHLVLTQKHRAETLQQAVKRLTDAFKALRRRSFWKEHFKGGLFAIEFTIDAQGSYHAHLHIMAFRTRFFDVQVLKDHWFEITGDSSVLRLDRIKGDDIAGGLREVLKYAVKPASIADFTTTHLRDFLKMKGQRLFGTFGEFQRFGRGYIPDTEDTHLLTGFEDLAEGSPCPHCSDPLFEVRVKGSDLPDFLRRVDLSAQARRQLE